MQLKSIYVPLVLLFSSILCAAETTTIKINGMHCGGCKAIVNKAVCESASLKSTFKKCEISVDEKIQVGTMVVEPQDGQTLDIEKVKTAITGAGDDYKIASVVAGTSSEMTASTPPETKESGKKVTDSSKAKTKKTK